jgi:hypothetical protein
MAEAIEEATEAHDKRVALIIAILALFLALAEAGAKNAEHRSTEQNIESSDLYNFYQARRIRASLAETAEKSLEAVLPTISDANAHAGFEKQIAEWKGEVARLEKDAKKPEDGLEAIQERAKAAAEARELSNQKLEHFEYASGALQIAIVLASAAIITTVAMLAWAGAGLGLLGVILMAFGYFAPTALPFFG